MILAEIVRHPAPAFHVEHDLLDAVFRRHIHGNDGLLADQPFGLEAVALLKSLHGDDKLLVINRRVGDLPFIVAGERPATTGFWERGDRSCRASARPPAR